MDGRRIRIGVSGHDLKFWMPLQKALEATGKYEFREDVWTGHDAHDPAKSQALLDWADVLVAEWALGNAVYYARRKRPHQRLIVRLHLQERGTPYPAQIDYSNVERVVFVGAHILRECVEKFSIPRETCTVLGNFVDVGHYSLPKFGGAEFTLGIIGTAPARKRLDLALDTLELLARRDDRYCLRVKGASPASISWLWARSVEREYYQKVYSRINSGPLRHRVIFDPQGHDVHRWLQMIGAILSPSDYESFHMAVSEGAASGAIPVTWAWEGAQEIYPEFQLVHSAEEAAALIEFHNRSTAGPRYREQVREIIRTRYDSSVITARWDELMSGASGIQRPKVPDLASKRDVLVVWAIDNWSTFHRREMLEALAKNVADRFDIVVVEPGNHYGTILKLGWSSSDELQRMAGGELVSAGGNIYRTRLFTSGIPTDIERVAYQSSSGNPLEVLDGLIRFHFGRSSSVLHWVYKPDQAQRLDGRPFIYEVYDDYTFDFGTGQTIEPMLQAEKEILPRAAHVFFTSQPLMDRKAALARASSLVGNGVNYEPFARFRPQASETKGRPVAGYLGNLSDFFDWKLMYEVCIAMPDIDFMFHGQIEIEKLHDQAALRDAMSSLPNVTFTGRVGRELGAAAVARYDVLLIPFVVNDAMHAVNPLKLWEYYATGRPVVTTPMEAIQEREPMTIVANGAEEWIRAIRRCLVGDAANHNVARARMERAELHRWDHLTRCHAAVLLTQEGRFTGSEPRIGCSRGTAPAKTG